MRIEGTITKVCELREGVSQSTGTSWLCRDIVVSWVEEVRSSDGSIFTKEHMMATTLRGDNAKNFSLGVGTRVGLNVTFKINEYNGRPIQNIYCSSIYVN